MSGTDGISTQSVRAEFTKRAEVPRREMSDAEAFARTLAATKTKPDAETLKTGQRLLTDLEAKKEQYTFNAAVLAGQEAADNGDLDRRVDAIVRNAERADKIATTLRRTLATFKP